MLCIDTLRAAQNNELDAVAQVITHLETRIDHLSRSAARRIAPRAGEAQARYSEEFAQHARVVAWEVLGRFTDSTVEAFELLAYTSMEAALRDAVRTERNGGAGVSHDAMKVFAAMVEAAEGDTFEAAKLAQTLPPKGRRLSAERAEACRLAWQGPVSLDMPTTSGDATDNATLADFLAHNDPEPEGEIRPKTGHGAALEALRVLERYAGVVVQRQTPGQFAANLPALVDALEESIRLPRDPRTRRYVLDAMGVLAAAVSTATDGDLTADLREVDDDRRDERSAKHGRVHTVLDSMGAAQRDVLSNSFGIRDAADFGWGDDGDLTGLAAHLGMTYGNAKVHRSKSRRSFGKRYVAATRLENPALADGLAIAAEAQMAQAGRK
ncbi:hypothetical protein ACIQ7S_03660 [Streptomyces griseoluteus]|uniref:hypothetical protein n=1 Tax=Streptomyces griseoluteus TaxID=29306 RepID=UPI00332C08D4